jgi:hypothetical protein
MYTLGLPPEITALGNQDTYTYTSWSGNTFTLDSNLTQDYDANYSCVAAAEIVSMLDMYSASVDWADELQNMAYDPPMAASGNFPLGGSQYTDNIFQLINDWRIKPANGVYKQELQGTTIQYSVDGGTGTEEDITDLSTIGIVEVTLQKSTQGIIFNPVTAENIADQVWDETNTDHNTAATMGRLLHDAGGSANPSAIATAVWDKALADHDTIGTFGRAMNHVYKIETGRWKIDTTANTMTFYDSDGLTPLITFNLKDATGAAASDDVYERDPV